MGRRKVGVPASVARFDKIGERFFQPLRSWLISVAPLALNFAAGRTLDKNRHAKYCFTMKISSLIFVVLVLCNAALAQGFANLNFDRSIVTNVVASGYGFDYGTAKITGWTVYDVFNYVNGDPSSGPFNDIALEAASVNLEGTNYFMPAIQGKYPVCLQGGSIYYDGRNGAAIGQTGQIPLTAQSIMY